MRVDVHIVDDGRAEQHRFERGQPAERDRLFFGEVVGMRYARCVGRREAHVLGHAARKREHGMCVHVDEAGRCQLAARIDDASRRHFLLRLADEDLVGD